MNFKSIIYCDGFGHIGRLPMKIDDSLVQHLPTIRDCNPLESIISDSSFAGMNPMFGHDSNNMIFTSKAVHTRICGSRETRDLCNLLHSDLQLPGVMGGFKNKT